MDVSFNSFLDLIDVDSFSSSSSFSRLKALKLSSNGIRFLHPRCFQRLVNLVILDLSVNRISELGGGGSGSGRSGGGVGIGGVFRYLQSLVSLNLSGNRLQVLRNGDLTGLSSLEELDLSSNQLVGIDSKAFDDLTTPSLKKLNLADNRLQAIPDFALSKLTNSLKSLNLDGNQIRELKGEEFCSKDLVIGECGFRKLGHLSLDRNG